MVVKILASIVMAIKIHNYPVYTDSPTIGRQYKFCKLILPNISRAPIAKFVVQQKAQHKLMRSSANSV